MLPQLQVKRIIADPIQMSAVQSTFKFTRVSYDSPLARRGEWHNPSTVVLQWKIFEDASGEMERER